MTTLDFSDYIADHTRGFTGREWVFESVDEWLAGSDASRCLLITGEPGSGKSALAAQLCRLSGGSPAPPLELLHLQPGFLSAYHFCSVRDARWIDPCVFAESLALQLAGRYPAYAKALIERSGDRQVILTAVQNIGTVNGGQATNIAIGTLNLSGVSPVDAFGRVVREPLEVLVEQGIAGPVVILIDGLDEALLYGGRTNIVTLLSRLQGLTADVRFILTSRPVTEVLRPMDRTGVARLRLSDDSGLARSQEDIEQYVLQALQAQPALGAKLGADLSPEELAATVRDKSEGNFLYVTYLLQRFAGQPGDIDREVLSQAPEGLNGIYIESLERLIGDNGDVWEERYAPVLGILAVAQDALYEEQLAHFAGAKASKVRAVLASVRQLLDWDEVSPAPQRRYTIYHRDFADFLLDRARAEEYWCEEDEQHERIVSYYLGAGDGLAAGRVSAWDDYGLRYTATHLARAADLAEQAHELVNGLVDLVTGASFQEYHLGRLGEDWNALREDLERTLTCAVADSPPESVPLVVRAAQALVAFYQETLKPEPLFDLACNGDVEAAGRRLALFTTELEWHQAVLLTIAWLASQRSPNAAQELRDRIADDLPTDGPLALLLKRVDATLEGTPLPTPDLPPSPTSRVVDEIVTRMGGLTVKEGHLFQYGMVEPVFEPTQASDDVAPVYLAEQDGPLLVAYAAENPGEGTRYLEEYLAIHAANNYVQYRNRSLWALMDAVVRHPDLDWVQAMLTALTTAALTGNKLVFREGLPLTILAIQASAGKPGADQIFEKRSCQILAAADELTKRLAEDLWERGRGDSWGHHKRRLAALAEASALLLDNRAEASSLLDQALDLPYGFAGFQAPACLTLNEAIRVCGYEKGNALSQALYAAEVAAHNIQDPTFCARIRARINAIMIKWQFGSSKRAKKNEYLPPRDSFDAVETIERLCNDPSAADFASQHWVGQRYHYRLSGPDKVALPQDMIEANTLEALSHIYQRPLADFLQLNSEQGWAANEPLSEATSVNVPDPEFAPLLAARFAAEALVDTSLSANRRVELIQSLVPIAAANPTALDTVLSRLLLAARLTDLTVLDGLLEIVENGLEKEWSGGWEYRRSR